MTASENAHAKAVKATEDAQKQKDEEDYQVEVLHHAKQYAEDKYGKPYAELDDEQKAIARHEGKLNTAKTVEEKRKLESLDATYGATRDWMIKQKPDVFTGKTPEEIHDMVLSKKDEYKAYLKSIGKGNAGSLESRLTDEAFATGKYASRLDANEYIRKHRADSGKAPPTPGSLAYVIDAKAKDLIEKSKDKDGKPTMSYADAYSKARYQEAMRPDTRFKAQAVQELYEENTSIIANMLKDLNEHLAMTGGLAKYVGLPIETILGSAGFSEAYRSVFRQNLDILKDNVQELLNLKAGPDPESMQKVQSAILPSLTWGSNTPNSIERLQNLYNLYKTKHEAITKMLEDPLAESAPIPEISSTGQPKVTPQQQQRIGGPHGIDPTDWRTLNDQLNQQPPVGGQ